MKNALTRGTWVLIGGVISKVTIVISHVRGLITTHEPPGRGTTVRL